MTSPTPPLHLREKSIILHYKPEGSPGSEEIGLTIIPDPGTLKVEVLQTLTMSLATVIRDMAPGDSGPLLEKTLSNINMLVKGA